MMIFILYKLYFLPLDQNAHTNLIPSFHFQINTTKFDL